MPPQLSIPVTHREAQWFLWDVLTAMCKPGERLTEEPAHEWEFEIGMVVVCVADCRLSPDEFTFGKAWLAHDVGDHVVWAELPGLENFNREVETEAIRVMAEYWRGK